MALTMREEEFWYDVFDNLRVYHRKFMDDVMDNISEYAAGEYTKSDIKSLVNSVYGLDKKFVEYLYNSFAK